MGTVYRSDSAIASPGYPAETKITILTSANGKRATKRFTPEKVEGYARESRWRWREAGISTFNDLARLLTDVEHDPLSLIVQGVVAPAWREKEIIPRTKRKGEPSLIDSGSRVVHFDIDDLPLPLGTGWHDPEGVARAIWQTVIFARVPAFAGVSFVWQASSSAGTPGKEHLAKLHLWAMLDQPIDEDHRKALLKLAGADDSLASINQPNYVAAPIFDRVPDPLADVGRSGVVIGTLDHACVDQIAWPEAKIKEAKERKPKAEAGPTITPEGLDHETSEAGRAILDGICGKIRTASQGGRNKLINRLAYLIGGHVAGGSIAYSEAREALLKAGQTSGHDRYVEAVENGLRDGLQRPIEPQEEAGADVGDQGIEPFHPAPQGDRAAAIAAHPATINAWADQNIPIMQATKAVARAYAEEMDHPDVDDPDREQKQAEIAKAQRAIRRRIRDQFGLDYLPASEITKNAPISQMMLTGAQGVGKTRAVVGADGSPGILHRAQGLVSILFEPDHAMAAQARRDYDKNASEGSAPSIVLRGRPAPDPDQPDEETMCRMPDVAGKLAAKGVSVPKALCERCPFADVCGYLRQEKEIKALAAAPKGVVIFAPHDYAFLPLPGLIEPDLAIFDERPRDYAVEEAQVSFEMLGEPLQFDRSLKAMNTIQATSEEADAQAANLRFIRPLMIALRNAGQDQPDRILGALQDQGIDQTHVVGAIAGLTYFQDRATAHAMRNALAEYDFAQMSGRPFNLEKRLEKEIESREGKIARTLQTIFQALLIEINKPREDAVGIGIADVQRRPGSRDLAKGIVAVRTKALRIGRVPFLHLDGTGDHRMAQRIFGKMDVAHHPVERSPADRGDRIIQVVGAEFHNAGLIGGRKGQGGEIIFYHGTWAEKYDAQRADILKAIKARPGALIIGNKSVIEALKPGEHGAHAAHFGAIRGRNDWEKIDRIMIIGREEPSPAKVERIARAFAAHDDAPFESLDGKPYPKAQRGIRKRDGSGHGIAVNFHPNAWADRVLKQIRDAEIVQAVDRIRPIFKDQPIEIILLSPVAVDLTVDQVIAWKDWRRGGTRIERALKQARVIPLSGREAARLLPDIWADKRSADRDLKSDVLLGQTVNRTFYLQNAPIRIGTVATYRAEAEPGKRSHEHKALIAAPTDQARAVLEALTGPLRHFEIIQVIEADPAAAEAAEAREERIAIIMHDGGLSEADAIRVADGLDVPDPLPVEPEDQSRRAIADVMDRFPTLTAGGFRKPDHPDLDHRDEMLSPKRVREFEIARDYIAQVGTTETATSRSPSSYEMKHVIERWAGQYVGNGMLITAALSMGVAIHNPIGSPNANLALSRRALSAAPGRKVGT
jgi:hypothetical protein